MSEYTIDYDYNDLLRDYYFSVTDKNSEWIADFKYKDHAQLFIDALEFKGVDPDCSLIQKQAG